MRFTRSLLMATALVALAAISPTPSVGADAKGNFALHGIGAQTCKVVGEQMETSSTSLRPMLTSWVLGYLSAMNRLQPDTYDASPVQSADALVDMVFGIC